MWGGQDERDELRDERAGSAAEAALRAAAVAVASLHPRLLPDTHTRNRCRPDRGLHLTHNAGGAAAQRNYAQANQAVSVRSQNVALSGEENIDLDVGKRHLLHANHHARRLHRSEVAAAGQH